MSLFFFKHEVADNGFTRRNADQIDLNILSRPYQHSGDNPDCRHAKPGRRDAERSKMKELSIKLHIFGRTHNDKGQAMVETALVLMLLVVLIFGMTEFGRAMYTKNMLNNTARAAARVAVVTASLPISGITYSPGSFGSASGKADCSGSGMTADLIKQSVCVSLTYALNYDQISAQVDVTQSSSNSGTLAKTNDLVTVSVTNNNFTSMVPALIGPTGLIPLSNILTGTATMRYE